LDEGERSRGKQRQVRRWKKRENEQRIDARLRKRFSTKCQRDIEESHVVGGFSKKSDEADKK